VDPRLDLRAEGSTLRRLPHAFVNKQGEAILVRTLDEKTVAGLTSMYLAYEPRNSFQGLPPFKTEACLKWVQDMVANGINLVALSFGEGVVGHVALFPFDDQVCELLVVVAPAFQNTGIGTQLTQCAVQIAYEIGFERIWLPVEKTNVRARHVYKKCGFACLPRQDPREMEMELDLKRYHDAVSVPVENIMNREVVSIAPEESCRRAVDFFLDRRIASLPVVDAQGVLSGILTETDLMLPSNLDKHVADILTHDVIVVREGSPLARVVRLFQSKKVRSIPVVDAEGRLVGIIGRKGVLAHYVRRL